MLWGQKAPWAGEIGVHAILKPTNLYYREFQTIIMQTFKLRQKFKLDFSLGSYVPRRDRPVPLSLPPSRPFSLICMPASVYFCPKEGSLGSTHTCWHRAGVDGSLSVSGLCTRWWSQVRKSCMYVYLVAQSCPTLCDPMDYSCQAPLSIGYPGKQTRASCHFLLQICLTQRLNLCPLHWQVDSLPLSHLEIPRKRWSVYLEILHVSFWRRS